MSELRFVPSNILEWIQDNFSNFSWTDLKSDFAVKIQCSTRKIA
jgi:hypothetical protein